MSKLKITVELEMSFDDERSDEAIGMNREELIENGIITIGETDVKVVDEEGTNLVENCDVDYIRKAVIDMILQKEA